MAALLLLLFMCFGSWASEVNRVNGTVQAVIQYVVDSLNEVAHDGLQISSRQQDANANWAGLSNFYFLWWGATF